MQGHDKDNLSRFFRKAMQKPEIKFNEDDWTKLEAMLDKAAADRSASTSRSARMKFISAAVIVLMVLSGITYFVATSPRDSGLPLSSSMPGSDISGNNANRKLHDVAGSGVVMQEDKSPGDGSTSGSIKEQKDLTTLSPYRQPLGALNTTPSPSRVFVTRKQVKMPPISRALFDTQRSIESNNDVGQDEKFDFHGNREKEKSITADDRSRKNVPFQTPVITNETNEQLATTVSVNRRSDEVASEKRKVGPDSVDNPLTLIPKDSTSLMPVDSSDRSSRMQQGGRWSILLSLAPDFSSNSFQHTTNPGEAVGISVYYRLAARLNVFVGVIGSNKKYVSYGKEYKPKEDHYWAKHTNGMVPTEIDGSCFMLEIPVGIQYDVVRAKRNRVLVSGMLSNYTMFNESYTYVFPSENPGAAQGWKSKKTTNYPFSVIGASATFEHVLSSRVAIGFSPYVKIPLHDMGTWTTMRLYSVGAALTLRYHFQPNKTLSHGERSD